MHPFQAVATAHGATVLRVCRALVGPVDAEDAWSETFLAALRAYPDLPPGSNVEAWLVTIAQRKAIDILRRRTRDPVPIASDEFPDAPSPFGIPGRGDTHAELWSALGKLTMIQRQAVVWHHLIGLPYAEVAEKIGNSPAAARRAGSDGIAALRHTLTTDPAILDQVARDTAKGVAR
nr:sigma-70 family RNA polymerase sigma factor [Tomitella biformata]